MEILIIKGTIASVEGFGQGKAEFSQRNNGEETDFNVLIYEIRWIIFEENNRLRYKLLEQLDITAEGSLQKQKKNLNFLKHLHHLINFIQKVGDFKFIVVLLLQFQSSTEFNLIMYSNHSVPQYSITTITEYYSFDNYFGLMSELIRLQLLLILF
jgi:hypothetical protein